MNDKGRYYSWTVTVGVTVEGIRLAGIRYSP
jgi:hypothetical protein